MGAAWLIPLVLSLRAGPYDPLLKISALCLLFLAGARWYRVTYRRTRSEPERTQGLSAFSLWAMASGGLIYFSIEVLLPLRLISGALLLGVITLGSVLVVLPLRIPHPKLFAIGCVCLAAAAAGALTQYEGRFTLASAIFIALATTLFIWDQSPHREGPQKRAPGVDRKPHEFARYRYNDHDKTGGSVSLSSPGSGTTDPKPSFGGGVSPVGEQTDGEMPAAEDSITL